MRGTFTDTVMEGFARKIAGDWYDIRETADDQYALEELYSFPRKRVLSITGDLRMAVDEGVSEYKRHILSNLYSFLESYRYDSRGFDDLSDHVEAFSDGVYVIMLQRLLAIGGIEIKAPKLGEQPEGQPLPGIKEIMQDVQERIAKDSELRHDQSVKNILMQISIYRKELEQMKELGPKILPDKKESFLLNFKRKFADITAKIQEHYKVIIKADEKVAAEDFQETNPLRRYDFKPLGKLLFTQAEEFSAIRSTLIYAAAERFKTRDILTEAVDRKDRTEILLEMELKEYKRILDGGRPEMLGKAFAQEIIKVLSRQISRMPE